MTAGPPVKSWRALAALLVLTACGSLGPGLQNPNVFLSNIDSSQVSVLEQRYNLSLRIQNPNDIDLRLSGLNYTVTLNGHEFARGVSSQHAVIPALGEQVVHVTVTSGPLDWLSQISQLAKNGDADLTYKLSGTLFIDNYAAGRLSFSHKGSFLPD